MARTRTAVEVPADLMAEIDRLVGAKNRSAFFADIAKREIKRLKLLKALENPEPIWNDADHPELASDSDAWARSLRLEAEERFVREFPQAPDHRRDSFGS